MTLYQELLAYQPFNQQEVRDKEVILTSLKENPEVFLRSSLLAHMSASAWIVNQSRDKVLMAYHNLYDAWSWLGGHADGEQDLLSVALKEVAEESGLQSVRPVSEAIYSVEVLTVDGHIKKGQYVSSHLHLNVTYLLEADEAETLQIKPDENSDVAWFSLEDAVAASDEKWFRDNIYTKLNEKLLYMKS